MPKSYFKLFNDKYGFIPLIGVTGVGPISILGGEEYDDYVDLFGEIDYRPGPYFIYLPQKEMLLFTTDFSRYEGNEIDSATNLIYGNEFHFGITENTEPDSITAWMNAMQEKAKHGN